MDLRKGVTVHLILREFDKLDQNFDIVVVKSNKNAFVRI